jgi:hypothetical protein
MLTTQILLNYFEEPTPNAESFGFKQRSKGPATDPIAAIPIDLKSVCPAKYIPNAADSAVRPYDAAAACSCLFIILLCRGSVPQHKFSRL